MQDFFHQRYQISFFSILFLWELQNPKNLITHLSGRGNVWVFTWTNSPPNPQMFVFSRDTSWRSCERSSSHPLPRLHRLTGRRPWENLAQSLPQSYWILVEKKQRFETFRPQDCTCGMKPFRAPSTNWQFDHLWSCLFALFPDHPSRNHICIGSSVSCGWSTQHDLSLLVPPPTVAATKPTHVIRSIINPHCNISRSSEAL